MQYFSVQQLADLAGVSVRTLHYYDQIELLKPKQRTAAGYRCYGEKELLRLQQILWYKALKFPLKTIRAILDDPSFCTIAALAQHKKALEAQQLQLAQLILNIEKTMLNIKTKNVMKHPAELYEGLPKESIEQIRTEAKECYGKITVETAEQALLKQGKAYVEALKIKAKENYDCLYKLMAIHKAEHPAVQVEIEAHFKITCAFWGESIDARDYPIVYTKLGETYIADERFFKDYGNDREAFVHFLANAMKHFVQTELS